MPSGVDVHAHAAPASTLEGMRRVEPSVVPSVDRQGDVVFFRYPNGVVNGPVPRGIVDVEHRLADMARTGVTHQVMSARPQFFRYDLPEATAAQLAALTNDGLVATAEADPEAMSVMISLPLLATDAALAEIERWTDNRIVRGVLVDSNVAGTDFAAPRLAPIWEALEAADLPVLVHPYQADVVGKERLGEHYLFNLIGNPADTTIAIGNVVFGGLLDRHPTLRWGFVHGGGVAPYLVGRWDHGWRKRDVTRAEIPDTPPSELLRRCWFDCLVHDARALGYLAQVVGWDRVTLGTDYPFDMGLDDPLGFLDRAGVSGEHLPGVLHDNAAAFLRAR